MLDLRKAAGFTDFFVIATGANARQVRAIAEAVQESLLAMRVKPSHTEGNKSSGWILLDYFDSWCTCSARRRAPSMDSNACGAAPTQST